MDPVFLLVWAFVAGVVLYALSKVSFKSDEGRSRGSEPGEGHHTLRSDYQSGLGGHSTEWKVPRDPQEYAKHFVPKGRKKEQEK